MDDEAMYDGASRVLAALAIAPVRDAGDPFCFYGKLRDSRSDIQLGALAVHAVFEGEYPALSETEPYDASGDAALGLPILEFTRRDQRGRASWVPLLSVPAASLLGLSGGFPDIRVLAQADSPAELSPNVSLGPRDVRSLSVWLEDICAPMMNARYDPEAFAIVMADRYNLLYETRDKGVDYRDQARFQALLDSPHIDAIRAVARARGDAIASDREVAAFMQTLDGIALLVDRERPNPCRSIGHTLEDLMAQARAASEAMEARSSEMRTTPGPQRPSR